MSSIAYTCVYRCPKCGELCDTKTLHFCATNPSGSNYSLCKNCDKRKTGDTECYKGILDFNKNNEVSRCANFTMEKLMRWGAV